MAMVGTRPEIFVPCSKTSLIVSEVMVALISAVRTLGLSAALMTKEVMDLAVAIALVSDPPCPDVGGIELLWQPTRRTKFNTNNKVNALFIRRVKDSQNGLPPTSLPATQYASDA